MGIRMDRNGILKLILLLILIVVDVSNASSSKLSTFRRFFTVASTQTGSSNTSNQGTPIPSPDLPKDGGGETTSNETNNSTSLKDLSSNSSDTNTVATPPPPVINKQVDEKKNNGTTNKNEGGEKKNDVTANKNEGDAKRNDGMANKNEGDAKKDGVMPNKNEEDEKKDDGTTNKNEEDEKKNDGTTNKNEGDEKKNDVTENKNEKENKGTDLRTETGKQNCTGILRWCKDDGSLVACILTSIPEQKKIEVLVQNEGESNLKVDISAPSLVKRTSFAISKHQIKKINLTVGDSDHVTFRAGNGECVLHTDHAGSLGNFLFNLLSYDRLITPINGAYFLIVTVFVFGSMSICCFFRRKKQRDGIPYQELEMAMPDSSLANNVESAEGWDQGWDDDWDEENAVKSPAIRHSGSISSNGLTSRSAKRDGWEDDWDD